MSDLGKVAHDLNNYIMIVISYTGFAIEGTQDDAVLQDLAEVRQAALKAAELTAKLRPALSPEVL